MNQSFYVGAIGAQQQQLRMNVQGNNIANVNTHGFKASQGRFASLMYQNMLGIDQAQLPAGTGANLITTTTDFTQGSVATTRRMHDYCIEGDGLFAVVEPASGQVTFTRCGAFNISQFQRPGLEPDENGDPVMETILTLADSEGRLVLDESGSILEVQDPNQVQKPGVFDYSNYDGIGHMEGSRFLPIDKNGGLWRGDGKVISGALEMSNVDLADEITKVIESQRAYGMALKMVQTSDEIENTINDLRR